MNDHLPECELLEPCGADIWEHGLSSRQQTYCIHCERACICERLRACEERVREEQCSTCCTRAEQQYVTEYNSGHDQGYKDGYGAAMDDGWGGASNEPTPGPIVKIDRWGASGRTGLPDTMPNGEWVKYRDHLEVVNASRQETIDEVVKRVEALLFPWPNTWPGMIRRGDVIAAIKGQTEKQSEEETQ